MSQVLDSISTEESTLLAFKSCADDVNKATVDGLIGQRKELIECLTPIIKNTENAYVIGLNSEWGSGKTYFLRAWQNYLRDTNPGSICVYFNAWKNDFSGDPLANLFAAIIDQASSPEAKVNDALKQGAIAVAGFGSKLCKFSGKIIKVVADPLSGAVTEFVGNAGEAFVNWIKEVNESSNAFNEKLAELSKETRNSTKFPIFVMIDELDRCRPNYTIELLERIKHLFNVPNVVFLLAIDGRQLLQQVEHTFGLRSSEIALSNNSDGNERSSSGTDTRLNYLGKFIDVFYSLPDPDRQDFVRMKLSKLPELQCYQRKLDIYGFFPLLKIENILTADMSMFGIKSLRELTQNIELFSLFLRIEAGIEFDEIFVATNIIFRNSNRMITHTQLDETFFKRFDCSHLTSIFRKLETVSVGEGKKELNNVIDLTSAEATAFLWIVLKLTDNKLTPYDDNRFFDRLDFCVANSIGLYTDSRGGGIRCGLPVSSIDKLQQKVIKKLQFLGSFSKNMQTA